jgi:hypothetical protein
MKSLFENLKTLLKKELSVLWIFSVVLGLALVVLQNKNKLPMGTGDFVFISILALCVALYRPRWTFYIFVSLIPLENIILVSGFLPLQLRPYQYAGVILIAAIFILWAAKRLNFKLLKPIWFDWLVFSLAPLGFLSLINSPIKNISLKNNLILFSFIALYFLARNFLRTKRHLIESAFFFLASNIVVLIYGFFQVFANKFGARSFEVMFGRPNSTFTEPDWLGVFLCFALAVLLSLLRFCHPERPPAGEAGSRGICMEDKIASHKVGAQIPPLPLRLASLAQCPVGMTKIIIYFLIFLNLTLLILTLSRSAWIGATAVIFFYLIFNLYKKDSRGTIFTPRKFANQFLIIFLVSLISLTAIHFGKLSKFDLFDRARSTATSEQKITIACDNGNNIPQTVASTDELAKYGCRHINLEEIDFQKSQGKFVTEIFRQDPNVMTRSAIYQKSWEILREHPVLGIGFGTITKTLGTDERGAGLNESNIFLQVWAGCGILGLISFAAILGYLFIFSFRRLSPICPLNRFFGCPIAGDDFEKSLNIFSILAIMALIIPNLFNAGLLMGLFWLGLGIFISCVYMMQ